MAAGVQRSGLQSCFKDHGSVPERYSYECEE